MALLAQEGRAALQQIGRRGPVRVVADSAVLGYRLVVVDERTTFFHVAGITSLVDAAPGKLFLTGRSMRAMAIGAAHLSFAYRMATWLAHLGPLLLVARIANFCLRLLVAYLVLAAMNLMTVRTRHVTRCMGTGGPEHMVTALVAGRAGATANIGRRRRIFAETTIDHRRLVAALVVHVLLARAVTISTGRGALVGGGAVLGLANGEDLRV